MIGDLFLCVRGIRVYDDEAFPDNISLVEGDIFMVLAESKQLAEFGMREYTEILTRSGRRFARTPFVRDDFYVKLISE